MVIVLPSVRRFTSPATKGRSGSGSIGRAAYVARIRDNWTHGLTTWSPLKKRELRNGGWRRWKNI